MNIAIFVLVEILPKNLSDLNRYLLSKPITKILNGSKSILFSFTCQKILEYLLNLINEIFL